MKGIVCWALVVTLGALVSGCPETGKDDDYEPIADADGDGFEAGADCDDGADWIHPGASDDCDDGVDGDCDGIDPSCGVDDDNDGHSGDDDCNDSDPSVYVGAYEDCDNAIDENCDGVATECIYPTVIYEPVNFDLRDSNGTAVHHDSVLFGDPTGVSGVGLDVGDGRAVFFPVEPGTVTEFDAAITSPGPIGDEGGYGGRIRSLGAMLAVTSEFWDNGGADDAGKSWVFDAATLDASTGTLDPADAIFTVESSEAFAYAGADALLDVNGDGIDDLIVNGAKGMVAIYGTVNGFSGTYQVPFDADVTFDVCSTSTDEYCGHRRAYLPAAIALGGGDDQNPDDISIFHLPVTSATPAPSATYSIPTGYGWSPTGMGVLPVSDLFVVGMIRGMGIFDIYGNELGASEFLPFEMSFPHVASVVNSSGHEILIVSNPAVGLPISDPIAWDVTEQGIPQYDTPPKYVLVDPPRASGQPCGVNLATGMVRQDAELLTVVTSACFNFGGAAYVLDSELLPPPVPRPSDIGPGVGENTYRIKRWVIDAFSRGDAWTRTLGDTTAVKQGTAITGWRLWEITTGSPLYLAGLRNGDILKHVNGTALTSPLVVMQLHRSLRDDSQATLGLKRGAAQLTLRYVVVN